jgi:hypothetical protein
MGLQSRYHRAMIARAWFALSLVWFVVTAGLLNWSALDESTVRECILISLLPFIAGLALKLFARYVLTGTLRRPQSRARLHPRRPV